MPRTQTIRPGKRPKIQQRPDGGKGDVDFRGHYDFSSVTPFVKAAWNHGMEVIWDLFHYGYPEDLDIFSDEFYKRFADYCYAVARFVQKHQEGPHYFTPVNEPSYLSWAGGDKRRFAPHCKGRASWE